ncbi:MAG: glycosyltransferase family 4 protein [Actinomycetota bacterium]|nr:glycosyltransferase family 4 protein [Actinomycetota bacterium]
MSRTDAVPPAGRRVVALVSDAIYPYHKGGKETRYHQVALGLAREGVEVHVFTMKWWDGPDERTVDGVRLHALCPVHEMYHGSTRTIRQAVLFALACLRLLRFDFDIIDADQMPHLPLFTIRVVARVKRVPLVVMWHEYWGADYWREYLGRLGPVAGAVERLSARLADETITPTSTTRDRLVQNGAPPQSVTVVPNGVDLEAIARAAPSAEHHDLLYVGRLIGHKHVDWLVSAVAGLASAGSAVTCAIVGDGPERPQLEALADRLGCAERIVFLGSRSDHDEVFGLMKSARLLVLPSTREGYGVVVAEALACGLPVVTTLHDENQARLLVDDGVDGWLCEPTPASLYSVVAEALSGSAPRREVRDVERFGWGAVVRDVLSVYDRALTRRASVGAAPRSAPTVPRHAAPR